MNYLYSNQTQLSQLAPQQKAVSQQQQPQQQLQQQQQQQQQQQSKPVDQHQIRNALSQSLTMLSGPADSKQALSTLSPLAPSLVQGVSQGQILNLSSNGSAFGGQILNLPNGNVGGGQNFYVMIPQSGGAGIPQIDTSAQLQKIAPMGAVHTSGGDSLSAARSEREEKRRQTHNEVERRRRSKINNWIQKLAEMVPACKDDMGQPKPRPGNGGPPGAPQAKSNCGVLQKTVNFIQELQIAHSQVVERLQEQNQVLVEMAKVRESVKRLNEENTLLRTQLQSHGIEPMDYAKQQQVSRPNI